MSDGDRATLSIDDNYRCGRSAHITVHTKSAVYFDKDAPEIQRLANASRGLLSFECPRIRSINFTGITSGTTVFSAQASQDSKWQMQTEPAPLEVIGLVSKLYDPDFFYLGVIANQGRPYLSAQGIKDTYQFKIYDEEARRIANIIDGDPEKFRTYIKTSGSEFKTFELALDNFKNILDAVSRYAPDYNALYSSVFDEELEALRTDYWLSQVLSIIEDYEKTSEQIIKKAENLAKSSSNSEFREFIDQQLFEWLKEESSYYIEDLAESSLFEISLASDFIADLPSRNVSSTLPETTSLIETVSKATIPQIANRLDQLYTLATDTIKLSGDTYEDVEVIFETGFALAQEFEESNYVDQGNALIGFTFVYIDSALKDGLDDYKTMLSTLQLDTITATSLQQQALAFEELSEEFEGFKAYQFAAEAQLEKSQDSICKSVLVTANVNQKDFNRNIYNGEQFKPLIELTCDLYKNGHVVAGFKPTSKPTIYTFEIEQSDGETNSFRLKAEKPRQLQNFKAIAQLSPESQLSTSQWNDYIGKLTIPPANGKPDIKGVRECDQLAADTHDKNKLAAGIDLDKQDMPPEIFDRAIDVCIAAVEDDPSDSRQLFQLGRLLWYAGDHEQATEYLSVASDAGYAPAMFYKAEVIINTAEGQNSFIDALELYKKSGQKGYARGRAMAKELNPDGLDFFREIPPPTENDILAGLKVSSASGSAFGMTKSESVVSVNIRECFQISATDFTCEYKPILKCGISGKGWGDDAYFKLMSKFMQADCNTAMYKFTTFRKGSSGKWQELSEKERYSQKINVGANNQEVSDYLKLQKQHDNTASQTTLKTRINSPDGYYMVTPSGITLIKADNYSKEKDYWNVQFITQKTRPEETLLFPKGEVQSRGYWYPNVRQFYGQSLIVPIGTPSCKQWSSSGWGFPFEPFSDISQSNKGVVLKQTAKVDTKRTPTRNCVNIRINTNTCELGRCNEYKNAEPKAYLTNDRDTAFEIFDLIR